MRVCAAIWKTYREPVAVLLICNLAATKDCHRCNRFRVVDGFVVSDVWLASSLFAAAVAVVVEQRREAASGVAEILQHLRYAFLLLCWEWGWRCPRCHLGEQPKWDKDKKVRSRDREGRVWEKHLRPRTGRTIAVPPLHRNLRQIILPCLPLRTILLQTLAHDVSYFYRIIWSVTDANTVTFLYTQEFFMHLPMTTIVLLYYHRNGTRGS